MSDDNRVPVTLVWLDNTNTPGEQSTFPEPVLRDIEEKFEMSAVFASSARPTAVGILNEDKIDEVEAFVNFHYPEKISFGLLY